MHLGINIPGSLLKDSFSLRDLFNNIQWTYKYSMEIPYCSIVLSGWLAQELNRTAPDCSIKQSLGSLLESINWTLNQKKKNLNYRVAMERISTVNVFRISLLNVHFCLLKIRCTNVTKHTIRKAQLLPRPVLASKACTPHFPELASLLSGWHKCRMFATCWAGTGHLCHPRRAPRISVTSSKGNKSMCH